MASTTLKILREVKGYKQEAIAEVLGISQNTYSRLERQPQKLTVEQAQKLSGFYSVEAEDLMSESTPTVSFHNPHFQSSNNGYIINVESDNRYDKNIEIESLKQEIEYLRTQNMTLIKALAEKK